MLHGEPLVSPPNQGWIDAIAVTPVARQQGLGTQLLEWATRWLVDGGCTSARLGGSLRPFAPGVPVELQSAAYFARRGFVNRYTSFDMAANLASYTTPSTVREVDAAVRPAHPGQEELLVEFLRREFPGRWRYEAEEYLREGGRISDFMLLWTSAGRGWLLSVDF